MAILSQITQVGPINKPFIITRVLGGGEGRRSREREKEERREGGRIYIRMEVEFREGRRCYTAGLEGEGRGHEPRKMSSF